MIMMSGCLSAGTHGYIKSYRYYVSKYQLQQAVCNVIVNSHFIKPDTVKGYYNDGERYITMSIMVNDSPYTYVWHFYGGSEYWDTSKSSALSIAYASDPQNRGGSEGNGGVRRSNAKLRKRLTEPFETQFIDKIDSTLGMKHVEE